MVMMREDAKGMVAQVKARLSGKVDGDMRKTPKVMTFG